MKMVVFWILTLLIVAASIGFSSAATYEDCQTAITVPVCYNILNNRIFSAGDNFTVTCLHVKSYVACIEYVACECGLTATYNVQTELSYMHGLYNAKKCHETAAGDLPQTKGVSCYDATSNTTIDGDMAILATEQSATSLLLEGVCTGYASVCYAKFDKEASPAVYNRDLNALCTVFEAVLQCHKTTACTCGQSNNTLILKDMQNNRNVYYRTCTTIRPEILYETGIDCDNTTADPCNSENPTYHCSIRYHNDMLLIGSNRLLQCTAFKTFFDCLNHLACRCGLIRDTTVYQSLLSNVDSYNKNNCSATDLGPLLVSPGIDCPDGNGTTDDEDSIALVTAESEYVIGENEKCPGITNCYSTYDREMGKALFEHNFTKQCIANNEWIQCLEDTYCDCSMWSDRAVSNNLYQHRSLHLKTCSAEAPLRTDFTCAFKPDQCETGNPLYTCVVDYYTNTQTAGDDPTLTCKTSKRYIECLEDVACQCGLIRDPTVYRSLTFAVGSYKANGCVQLSGPIRDAKGITNCPGGNVTSDDETMLILSSAETSLVLQGEKQCAGIKACFKEYDAAEGFAIFHKNVHKTCLAKSVILECLEYAYCDCGRYDLANVTSYLAKLRQDYTIGSCPRITNVNIRLDFECFNPCIRLYPVSACIDTYDGDMHIIKETTMERCRNSRGFIGCLNKAACQCGLMRNPDLYRNLTFAITPYKKYCVNMTGDIPKSPGMTCMDGKRASVDEIMIAIQRDNTFGILSEEKFCPGTKACMTSQDSAEGTAIFNKDLNKLCAATKTYISCQEDAYCSCGKYKQQNISDYLTAIRNMYIATSCATEVTLDKSHTCVGGASVIHGQLISIAVASLFVMLLIHLIN